jgi:hypothetical protein
MRMRIVQITWLALLVSVSSTGCATLFKSKQSTVMINSQQPGAAVLVDGQQVAVTPAQLTLSNGSSHMITVRGAAGERTCRVESSVSVGWVILDIVASPAWIVDLITGDWRKLDAGQCMNSM